MLLFHPGCKGDADGGEDFVAPEEEDTPSLPSGSGKTDPCEAAGLVKRFRCDIEIKLLPGYTAGCGCVSTFKDISIVVHVRIASFISIGSTVTCVQREEEEEEHRQNGKILPYNLILTCVLP